MHTKVMQAFQLYYKINFDKRFYDTILEKRNQLKMSVDIIKAAYYSLAKKKHCLLYTYGLSHFEKYSFLINTLNYLINPLMKIVAYFIFS